jgi:alginate O-acetyltransferase complex protein AlgI
MLFCTPAFYIFFLVVFAVYWLTPRPQLRVWILLAASFCFYAKWNKWLACLVCFTSVMDYVVARGMEASPTSRRKRLLLVLSLVMNLGVLVYFKYANFFIQSFAEMLGSLGLSASWPLLHVILPVGISFYTFEAINYTVDVYRGKIPAERNLGHFMLFILFFPHLVAGPIVRARDFLHQIKRPKRWSWPRLQLGLLLFLLGLLKKLGVADHLAHFVDPVFANPGAYGTEATWYAVLAYALQIYCDFSGYSDMALGTAHMLGYKLAQNFNMPYIAVNVSEFWHRWHMSLSGWLRDYLFIPLGGSRGSGWKTARNLMITMTLGGLWHGASWTFVLWGVAHGLLLIGHRLWRGFCKTRPRLDWVQQTAPGTALRMGLTFLCVILCWVLFRAASEQASLLKAGAVFSHLLLPQAGAVVPVAPYVLWVTLGALALGHLLTATGLWKRLVLELPAPVLGFTYASAVCLVLVLAADQGKTFIYFQF